jgi:hypothetical protein
MQGEWKQTMGFVTGDSLLALHPDAIERASFLKVVVQGKRRVRGGVALDRNFEISERGWSSKN